MAQFDITDPQGRKFRVTAPDGATQDEVLAYAKQQFASQKTESGGFLADLDRLDAQSRTQQSAPRLDQDGTAYIAQQLKKGVAAGLGAPVDTITNALNLGIAGYGVAKRELTGSSDLPELIRDPLLGSNTFERMFLTNNAIQPTGEVNRIAGRVVRDLGTAAVPAAAMARNPTAFMPRNTSPVQALQAQSQNPLGTLAAAGTLSTTASLGGELGRAVAPEPYKDAADMTGALLGGIALPAAVMSRVDAGKQLLDSTKDNNVNRVAGQYVQGQLVDDVRNYPGARDRLNEALALQEQIPGFQPRVGQGSGVPSLLDMEHRVAVAGPEQFNRRALQDSAQHQAIMAEAQRRLPLLARNDLDERLNVVQGERAGLANALPQAETNELGRTLRDARGSLKARYDAQAAQKFDAPVKEAEKLRTMIDHGRLILKSDEILSNPLLKYDPQNAPNVVRRINALQTKEGPILLDADGQPIQGSNLRIPFSELKGMREAVNQDIARESTNVSSESRQRLRALVEMRDEIDNAAMQAPESVRKLWGEAREWYRDVYAPKFLRGLNLKQTSKDITGELRISDEKLPAQYFKKMGSTPMSRFLQLYSDSPQAMRAMEDHILDTYRREVVKDGFIDPKKHEIFTRNYEPSLRQLPEVRDRIGTMGQAAAAMTERETQIINAQSLLNKGALDRMRFDDPNTQGLDPRKVNSFLTKSGADFEKTVSDVYGPAVAKDHMENLRKIAKASEIADRGALHPSAQPQQSTNPLDMRQRIGFGSRTVFNMIRAVTTGRTSSEDVAFTLGMQSATHRISRALIAAEERAISDPTTAKLVADSLNQPITSQAGQSTLRKLLERGGLFVAKTASGSDNYERMGRYRAAPFAIEANQDQENQ